MIGCSSHFDRNVPLIADVAKDHAHPRMIDCARANRRQLWLRDVEMSQTFMAEFDARPRIFTVDLHDASVEMHGESDMIDGRNHFPNVGGMRQIVAAIYRWIRLDQKLTAGLMRPFSQLPQRRQRDGVDLGI